MIINQYGKKMTSMSLNYKKIFKNKLVIFFYWNILVIWFSCRIIGFAKGCLSPARANKSWFLVLAAIKNYRFINLSIAKYQDEFSWYFKLSNYFLSILFNEKIIYFIFHEYKFSNIWRRAVAYSSRSGRAPFDSRSGQNACSLFHHRMSRLYSFCYYSM